MARTTKPKTILDRRFAIKGDMLIKEGDFGSQAFLIQSGEVQVFLSSEDKEVELARLGPGEIVGEMALVFDGPRTANVRVLEDCNLIVISRMNFEDKVRDTDATIRAIVHMLSRRIIDGNNTLLNKRATIDDLKDAARTIYQNIAVKLNESQLKSLQSGVLPKLEEFLEALERFKDRYGA